MDKLEVNPLAMYDGGGNEQDMAGNLYTETFTPKEYMHLGFMVFLLDAHYSDLLATDASQPVGETITSADFRPKIAPQASSNSKQVKR